MNIHGYKLKIKKEKQRRFPRTNFIEMWQRLIKARQRKKGKWQLKAKEKQKGGRKKW